MNSPILDISIGLVFIFLLYSLLATTIVETIASAFALRARMLRKGIIKGMLSNTDHRYFTFLSQTANDLSHVRTKFKDSEKNTWLSLLEAFANFFVALRRLCTGAPYNYEPNTLGGDFYMHPIIKNFGRSRRYSVPSYITKTNFSAVMLDNLEKYFNIHIDKIKLQFPDAAISLEMQRITKIGYLLAFYAGQDKNLRLSPSIDFETLDILQLYLKESGHNLTTFTSKLEEWFDATMDRVTGWYKRQGQGMLLTLGLVMAFAFNLDIIDIAGKLHQNPELATAMAENASKMAEGNRREDILSMSSQHLIKEINNSNQLLGLGWGDFGYKHIIQDYQKRFPRRYANKLRAINDANRAWYDNSMDSLNASILTKKTVVPADSVTAAVERLKTAWHVRQVNAPEQASKQLHNSRFAYKVGYIISHTDGGKMCSFMLFALGIWLGAPFWFDLLQKLVQIRSAGKKENTSSVGSTAAILAAAPPAVVNIHTNQTTEGAVG